MQLKRNAPSPQFPLLPWSYPAFYIIPTPHHPAPRAFLHSCLRLTSSVPGSLKIEIGPRTVGMVEVIYDGDGDPSDTVVNTARPGGLKSPFSGLTVGGTVEPDPAPLDVSNLLGITTIIGDWDQDGAFIFLAVSCCTMLDADLGA